jgi:thioesterase domain-containing protein
MDEDGDRLKRDELSSRVEKLSPAEQALLRARVQGKSPTALPDLDTPRAGRDLRDEGLSSSSRLRHVPEDKSSGWSPLVKIQRGSSNNNFICAHSLSGLVTDYVQLARHMGADQTFYALQSQGIGVGGEPHTQMETMAAYYLEAVREIQPEGPYLLGGNSLGGHIAFEMAQQLRAEGSTVALLALIDTPRFNFKFGGDGEFDDALYWNWRYGENYCLPLSLEHLQGLDPDGRLDYVVEHLKRGVISPPFMKMRNVNPQRMLKVELGNRKAVYNYEHKPYPGRITLLRAGEASTQTIVPHLGWGPLAVGGVEIHWVPGDHNTVIEPPNVAAVGRVLRECVDKATRE